MICELRIYRCVPGPNSALLPRFENGTCRSGRSTASARPGLDHADRQEQPGDHLYARLGQHGRTRKALGRLSCRSGVGCSGRKDGEGRPVLETSTARWWRPRRFLQEVRPGCAHEPLSGSCELTLPGVIYRNPSTDIQDRENEKASTPAIHRRDGSAEGTHGGRRVEHARSRAGGAGIHTG